MSAATESADRTSRWWLPIGALVCVVLLQGAVSFIFPPDPAKLFRFMAPLIGLGLLLQLVSPVCLYYDRQYLETATGWEPSSWYYLMVLPPFSVFLPPLYLYQRHRYVGVP